MQKSRSKLWFFDKDKKWHEIKVRSTEPHFVTCRSKKKGPALKIAYEDIRLAPENFIDFENLSSELGGLKVDVEDPIVQPSEDEDTDTPMKDTAPVEKDSHTFLGSMGDVVPKETHLRISVVYRFQMSHHLVL